MWVIDASVAIKWFFEEEDGSLLAYRVLGLLVQKPDLFMVPTLFFIEFAAVALKKSKDVNASSLALDRLYRLGLHAVPEGEKLLAKALQLSHKFELSLYDGLYLAVASLMKAHWLTADERAVRRLPPSLALSLRNFDASP